MTALAADTAWRPAAPVARNKTITQKPPPALRRLQPQHAEVARAKAGAAAAAANVTCGIPAHLAPKALHDLLLLLGELQPAAAEPLGGPPCMRLLLLWLLPLGCCASS